MPTLKTVSLRSYLCSRISHLALKLFFPRIVFMGKYYSAVTEEYKKVVDKAKKKLKETYR
ncbi:hypothetical protein PanWU01x14_095160 [Parasponia andersonii]|uniref:Uncharacterized protein n=1 Tax=Parasponia andersonii TaxID=3476 RepID=A0A2P5D5I8_PARAD|nr:hypothetical protein PanWU01x14_095160 [Parasponia andersonii]